MTRKLYVCLHIYVIRTYNEMCIKVSLLHLLENIIKIFLHSIRKKINKIIAIQEYSPLVCIHHEF